jgi:hypothetical protein
MFELIKDYNGNGIQLKKGEYSKEQLIKLYSNEGRFNYCLTCTSLKEVLLPITQSLKEKIVEKVQEVIDIVSNDQQEEKIEESNEEEMIEEPNEEEMIEEPNEEEMIEEPNEEVITIFIAKENLKKNNKIVFKKDDKITYEELEQTFGNDLNSIFDKLIETKISKNVSI